MTERWAILVILTAAIAGWSFFALTTPVRGEILFALAGALLSTMALLAWWCGTDARARGIAGLRRHETTLLVLAMPVGLGAYLMRSRGVALGLLWLIGFGLLGYLALSIGLMLANSWAA